MAITVAEKVKRARPKLTTTQKAARCEKATGLTNAIDEAREEYHEKAAGIAEKYKRTVKWTKCQLNAGPTCYKLRKPNAWNAFVWKKLQQTNAELDAGSCWKLPAFIAAHRSELLSGYAKLTEVEKEVLRHEVAGLRAGHFKIAQSSTKGLQKQVNAAFVKMEQDWTTIANKTGIEGFYVAVRGDVEHFHEAKIFYTPKARSFMQEISNLDPKRFALKFESWVTGNFDTHADVTQRLPAVKIISLCRKSIQDGLDAVLQKHKLSKRKVNMNYDNYEGRLSRLTALRSKAGLAALFEIRGGLATDELETHKKLNQEHNKRGEAVYKPRKARSRKVVNTSLKSAETVDTEDDEGEGQEDGVGEQHMGEGEAGAGSIKATN
ncbi:hypothetical protein HYDPIDRAFT_31843 [Hydnomerulius pinastri MD-312]|uniref:Uncharacterized protein n=1 Tax=Hydnomerulius pinastri MD-312 TaxID=994086 RepID=A0A0C9WBN4_9AGAM|nr:hypothetical protein HYDPIDRAFT_31843 [Hydnomerulius pinastri MD-312]